MKPNKPLCPLHLLLVTLGVILLACEDQKERPKGGSAKRDVFAANHSSWYFTGKSSDNDYYYYNTKLVRVTESETVMLWFKEIELAGDPNTTNTKNLNPADQPHVLLRLEVSCPKEEYRLLEYVEVTAEGKRNDMKIEPAAWTAVIPDTVGHMWHTAACSTPDVVLDKTWKAVKNIGGTLLRDSNAEKENSDEK